MPDLQWVFIIKGLNAGGHTIKTFGLYVAEMTEPHVVVFSDSSTKDKKQ